MIAYLSGKIFRKASDHVIVMTGEDGSGVGYKVYVTPAALQSLPAAGEKASLEIHTIVREDDIALYGFLDVHESKLFNHLLSVSGVGPKLALTVLANCSWEDVVAAVENEDIQRLRAIKGIGEKTAKMLVLGLKSKLAEWAVPAFDREIAQVAGKANLRSLTQDAESALMSLGFSRGDVQKTLSSIKIMPEASLQQVIKQSLQILSGGGAR